MTGANALIEVLRRYDRGEIYAALIGERARAFDISYTEAKCQIADEIAGVFPETVRMYLIDEYFAAQRMEYFQKKEKGLGSNR
jgi:hypothetical protein